MLPVLDRHKQCFLVISLRSIRLKLRKVIVMNEKTIMAKRLLQIIKPRQAETIRFTPHVAREAESRLNSFKRPELSSDWLGLASLMRYSARGESELRSPLSD